MLSVWTPEICQKCILICTIIHNWNQFSGNRARQATGRQAHKLIWPYRLMKAFAQHFCAQLLRISISITAVTTTTTATATITITRLQCVCWIIYAKVLIKRSPIWARALSLSYSSRLSTAATATDQEPCSKIFAIHVCVCVGVRARLCRTLAIHNFFTCHIFYYVSRAVDILWALFYFYYNRRVCACLCMSVRVGLQATTS